MKTPQDVMELDALLRVAVTMAQHLESIVIEWSKKMEMSKDRIMSISSRCDNTVSVSYKDGVIENMVSINPRFIVIKRGDNRNPHADMLHEWAETGRKVEYLDSDLRWKPASDPSWYSNVKYRWADEPPKPDVVLEKHARLCEQGLIFGMKPSQSNPANIRYTFDAEGTLKNVELLK